MKDQEYTLRWTRSFWERADNLMDDSAVKESCYEDNGSDNVGYCGSEEKSGLFSE